jgi:DNA-binding HxlR family transcriptional regulator
MDAEVRKLDRFRVLMGTLVKKWTVEIMYCLYRNRTMRFSELRRLLGGVSSRTLSDRLKELEGMGLVTRRVSQTRPVRVEYSLTEGGRRIGEEAYSSFERLISVWDEVISG